MHAFLFDAEHSELADDPIFGPPCTSRVVGAVERRQPLPAMRIIRGKVIPETLCYDISGFTLRSDMSELIEREPEPDRNGDAALIGYRHVIAGPTTARADEMRYEPDEDRFKTIVCDMAESLSAAPSTVDEQALLVHLARGLIWAVTPSGLTDDQALEIDRELRQFAPYLGMSKLDLGNPVHRDIMIESMFHEDVVLDHLGIAYRVEPFLDQADIDEAMHIALGLGSAREPRLVEEDDFAGLLPPIEARPLSERGELSRARVGGKMTPSHRERVARALLEHHEGLSNEQRIEFSTAKDAGVRDFEFDPRKFTDYLFNVEHKDGGPKAKFFIGELGISPDDWKFLADQIERGMASAPIYRAVWKTHGFSHGAYVLVTGRNGKLAVLETGWIIEAGKPARFVTAYPGDAKHAESLHAPPPVVVDPKLAGDARWEAVYVLADEAGRASAAAITPTPMVLEGYATIWDGPCGFGWAHLPSARHPMARWLLKLNKGRKSFPGVEVWSPVLTQSMDRNRAYAEAFAGVLNANGVECSAHHRLD